MKPKMIWANLTVKDLQRTSDFYTRLGFEPNSPHTSEELVSFFFGDNKLVIHFFRKDSKQFNMHGKIAGAEDGNEVMFSMSADTKEEVDNWVKEAAEAGATILKEAGEDENGFYYCVFADPDGHKFNVLWVKEGM